jgi:hypothetical protein
LDRTIVRWINKDWLAPWAWTEVRFGFSLKTFKVSLLGSAIPSHVLFMGEDVTEWIDMLEHAPPKYKTFNQSGACVVARDAYIVSRSIGTLEQGRYQ